MAQAIAPRPARPAAEEDPRHPIIRLADEIDEKSPDLSTKELADRWTAFCSMVDYPGDLTEEESKAVVMAYRLVSDLIASRRARNISGALYSHAHV